DHPAVSCMASQYAGWAIQVGKYFAMGSGPLRAHARVEKELFAKLGYAERAERGVLVLETRTLPTDEVASWVGQKAGLAPSPLTPNSLSWLPRFPRRHRRTTGRRSTTSSSGTTAISTRSTRCSSAPPRCG